MGKHEVAVAKEDLIMMLQAIRCEKLHHTKADRHGFMAPCPVIQRLWEKYAKDCGI